MSHQDWPTLKALGEVHVNVDLDAAGPTVELAIGKANGPHITFTLDRDDLAELQALMGAALADLRKIIQVRENTRAAAELFVANLGGLEAARAAIAQLEATA